MSPELLISIVIPTYRRERVLLETLDQLLTLPDTAGEILVIDQTEQHEPETIERLEALHAQGAIRWIHQQPPSITAAMNRGLQEANGEVVLFLDDDIAPEPFLVRAHQQAHEAHAESLIAGRVIQSWEEHADFSILEHPSFAGNRAAWIADFIGCNFSLRRERALALGGFDENFVRVAYRYEAEFAHRFCAADGRIRFEPEACLHHLHVAAGGTRSYGHHLTTWKPDHAVGAYYCALRIRPNGRWIKDFLMRPMRAVISRHHLRRPWWIPVTLAAELRGMLWALRLHFAGPKLIGTVKHVS